MLKRLKQTIINHLWHNHAAASTQVQLIEAKLAQLGIKHSPLDHFAVIDLPGPHSGIPVLRNLFESLGFIAQGTGYLPEKQNDFLWLADPDGAEKPAADALPQVVVADFRPHEMPIPIQQIIEKYATQASPLDLEKISRFAQHEETQLQAIAMISHYLNGRDWPLPTIAEFQTVQEFNELLAWVLVFGRRPNHFTFSVHLMNQFNNLEHFQDFIETEVKLALNTEGGKIKGDRSKGIAQGSTTGEVQTIKLADGEINIPGHFVEFVWRFPKNDAKHQPKAWNDYFTGFIANHANHVIESLYE